MFFVHLFIFVYRLIDPKLQMIFECFPCYMKTKLTDWVGLIEENWKEYFLFDLGQSSFENTFYI